VLGRAGVYGGRVAAGFAAGLLAASCWTVDLGDNVPAPDLQLDEDFFYCRIQPEIISVQTCASGASGEGGMCHSEMTSLRLNPAAETDPPPPCDGDRVTGAIPASYTENFQAVQFTVQSDPLSSPFYRRPVGLDSHPRIIFPEGSPEADLIVEWIAAGGS
jgi:hypothetical protein